MKFTLLLFALCSLLSCTSKQDGNNFSKNNNKILFSEDFNLKDLGNLDSKFFVLGGNYVPARMGGRHAIASNYSGVTQNALLFGSKKLKNYTLEASYFFTSTAPDTIAAGMGGAGQRGFKIHLVPQGNNQGILRLAINGNVFEQSDIKMIPDTWYKIYLKVSHSADGSCTIMSTVSNETMQPKKWLISRVFPNTDYSGQVSVLTFPVSRIPVYIDDITIRSNE